MDNKQHAQQLANVGKALKALLPQYNVEVGDWGGGTWCIEINDNGRVLLWDTTDGAWGYDVYFENYPDFENADRSETIDVDENTPDVIVVAKIYERTKIEFGLLERVTPTFDFSFLARLLHSVNNERCQLDGVTEFRAQPQPSTSDYRVLMLVEDDAWMVNDIRV